MFLFFLLLFFVLVIYIAIFFNSYSSKDDFMCYEKCDKVSCKYCTDFEQCNPNN